MKKVVGLFIMPLAMIGVSLFVQPTSVSAFNAGRIIDDAVFTNHNTMSVGDIQNFLNSKVPNCDTNGDEPSEYGGGTRRDYAASRGVSPPFTCLKDYHQNGKSAAQIIYDAGKEFRINPQVLIVLLQKEQGLVTDEWPWPVQYRSATGYGCPDNAPCDSQYYGLTNQLRWAARMFRAIMDDSPTWYTPYILGNNQIPWHPDTGRCGYSTVNIENRATKALYNYTPYRPNQAALNAGYGMGDSCSSYGNRNFYLYFRDWFGSPFNSIDFGWTDRKVEFFADSARTRPLHLKNKGRFPTVEAGSGQKIYVRVTARNNGYRNWEQSFLNLGTEDPRDHKGILRDESWLSATRLARLKEATVTPGNIGTFEFSVKAPAIPGTYIERFKAVADGHRWLDGYSCYVQLNVTSRTSPSSTNDTLEAGEELKPNEFLLSRDRHHVFRLHHNGSLVIRNDFQNGWVSNKYANPQRLTMQSDGNLVLYNTQGAAVWASNTAGNPGARLVMQDDGNAVIYTAGGAPIWASNTSVPINGHTYVSRYLFRNFVMQQGQELQNPSRTRRLVLQTDGNLVLYNTQNGQALWASGTHGRDGYVALLQDNGVLAIRERGGKTIWSTGTGGRGGDRLTLHDNGRLYIYANDRQLWSR